MLLSAHFIVRFDYNRFPIVRIKWRCSLVTSRSGATSCSTIDGGFLSFAAVTFPPVPLSSPVFIASGCVTRVVVYGSISVEPASNSFSVHVRRSNLVLSWCFSNLTPLSMAQHLQ
jgi:hypothetical protein